MATELTLTQGELKMASHAVENARAIERALTAPVTVEDLHEAKRQLRQLSASVEFLTVHVGKAVETRRAGHD